MACLRATFVGVVSGPRLSATISCFCSIEESPAYSEVVLMPEMSGVRDV
jgi:hypothetical protein